MILDWRVSTFEQIDALGQHQHMTLTLQSLRCADAVAATRFQDDADDNEVEIHFQQSNREADGSFFDFPFDLSDHDCKNADN